VRKGERDRGRWGEGERGRGGGGERRGEGESIHVIIRTRYVSYYDINHTPAYNVLHLSY
jgi:hypothetical protein